MKDYTEADREQTGRLQEEAASVMMEKYEIVKAMFHGFDFDSTMLRIGSMNMLLHGIENPMIQNRDSLAEDHSDAEEVYTLVLANPPFAGSLDYEAVAKDLLHVVRTKKTELLFLCLPVLHTGRHDKIVSLLGPYAQ